jgi:para-nitrobenzyl esterase
VSADTHDELFPVVEITTGCIRGLANNGVRTFRGIPYGEDTASRRFQPPRPRAPWAGVRDCFGPGPVAPQRPSRLGDSYAGLIHFDLIVADGGMSEDCLSLNVWARGARDDGGKRPVIVILHGGGHAIGSGNAAMYDGSLLALEQDVVVVSIIHRLASFAYLELGDRAPDERFAVAGHCGLLDIALALEWVRDNAEAFGGDPGRVTLMGQSGGGWKVCAMMALPAARGLFHRAVVQSGSWPRFLTREEGAALTAALFERLGLARNDLAALLALDFTRLIAAQEAVGALFFQPVLHPAALPAHPFSPEGLAVSREVPLIISTTLDDAGLFFDHFDLTESGLSEWLVRYGKDAAARLLAWYRARYPTLTPYLLHARMITDSGFRRYAHIHADARTAIQGGAPTWAYRWDWPSPAWDGRFGATHAIDVPASLAHCHEPLLGGGVANGRRLTTALSAAIAGFSAVGDPATPLLPLWPAYTRDKRSCLLLGASDTVVRDPDAETRALWEPIIPEPQGLLG